MIIAVDAMGGDNAPSAVVEGCIQALEDDSIKLIFCGKEKLINEELSKYKYDSSRVSIVNAEDIITNNEHPAMAIKKKKDSSLVKALNLVKDGSADGIISAGSTGALLTGATVIIGRIKGVKRPALAPIMPGKNNSFMVIDVGANVDCKPEYLPQFALMGKVYFEAVMKINNPTVGLVNIGSEEEKGNELTKGAFPLLKEAPINFVGNVEPREIPYGDVNILVCDGFVGNTILKTYEGVASSILGVLKEEIMSSTRTKIGGILLKPVFKIFKQKFDYKEVGGSAFLGTNGICIKAHGSSDARAFKNAVRQANLVYENKVIDKITEGILEIEHSM
ncbi:phosphate acyltransferase PlsX [Clostridium cellulovorans]|uniref:Phosphate acyltransferase n=1 Tax=Clostridium cellulovorans (strain ATCC 35296 / DSM 3052 / OCM 3 / 743B) TaxID=573061 RepID=D9SLC3_CLOC7|nr:phosphate acyltransferase PlsX [Clostridium cellulovorans]ADL51639.1 fatty acid/phospholipid synthesis protein PlsX [Clostridium cellulovorans 743B]